jgi:UTP--glucose-1-phosphate uridylyltransferase
MVERQNQFGRLLRDARKAKGLSQRALAQHVSLDPSYINRLEAGERRPSQDAVLNLAEALGICDEFLDTWLIEAGFAPIPALRSVHSALRNRGALLAKGAVRTRGGLRRPRDKPSVSGNTHPITWKRLKKIGLQDAEMKRLLRAIEIAGLSDRRRVAEAVSGTFGRMADALESPVSAAVIPAAGGQHRLIAAHVIQRLLLRVIREAVGSGISRIVLILAPGTRESLYLPIKDAIDIAIVPYIELRYVEQPKPEGLGDAILRAEAEVENKPFAVLLPDDFIQEQSGRTRFPVSMLQEMISTFNKLENAHLLIASPVAKTRMTQCGVVQLSETAFIEETFSVEALIEKPPSGHSVCNHPRAYGIVGRYVLQPNIFFALKEMKTSKIAPLELTDALVRMRRSGEEIYALEIKKSRQNIGELFKRAGEFLD